MDEEKSSFSITHLTEDGEFRTDEGEMVDILLSEVVRKDLLHWHADVEDLAVVELVCVVSVRLKGTNESHAETTLI